MLGFKFLERVSILNLESFSIRFSTKLVSRTSRANRAHWHSQRTSMRRLELMLERWWISILRSYQLDLLLPLRFLLEPYPLNACPLRYPQPRCLARRSPPRLQLLPKRLLRRPLEGRTTLLRKPNRLGALPPD